MHVPDFSTFFNRTAVHVPDFSTFFNRTAVHFPDFQLFLIRAVDIFQCFCRAVAIRAVVHFGLKLASARQDMYGILF